MTQGHMLNLLPTADSSQLTVRAQEMLRSQWMSLYMGSTGSPGDERLLACKSLKWT